MSILRLKHLAFVFGAAILLISCEEKTSASAGPAPVPEAPKTTNATKIEYVLDRDQNNVISLANLDSESLNDKLCHKYNTQTINIVDRTFDNNPLIPSGIYTENEDGSRSHININSIVLSDYNRVDAGWISNGIQVLTRIGRTAQVEVFYCGVSGSVATLDSIR